MKSLTRHQSFCLFQVLQVATNNSMQDHQAQTYFVKSSTVSSSPNQKQYKNGMAWSEVQEEPDLFEKELECPVFETRPMKPLTTDGAIQNEVEQERLMSCPIRFSLLLVEKIEKHADNFSMCLLHDTNEQSDIPNPSPTPSCNTEPATAQHSIVYYSLACTHQLRTRVIKREQFKYESDDEENLETF